MLLPESVEQLPDLIEYKRALIDSCLGSEERVQRISEVSMGFDILKCDNRFADAEISVVVLGLDKILSWAEQSEELAECSFLIIGKWGQTVCRSRGH
jgi:hypothetical protein